MALLKERAFDCPAVVFEQNTGPIILPGEGGDNTPATEGDGRSIERLIISAEGMWSNVDVHLNAPTDWATPGSSVQLRLYAVTTAGRSLVAEVLCEAAGLRAESGRVFGIVLSGRGHPCDAWQVIARTSVTRESAQIQMQVWGTESTPEGIGNAPGGAMADARVAVRAAQLMGYDSAQALQWQPLAVEPGTQRLQVQIAGGSLSGSAQPADNFASPTNAVTTWSLAGLYDGVTWDRARSNGWGDILAASVPPVLASTAAFLWGRQLGTENAVRAVVDGNGNLQVVDVGLSVYTDNVGYFGGVLPLKQVVLNHRAQAGNNYATRGGYTAGIAAADFSAILNTIGAGVFSSAAPAVTNSNGAATQIDNRGSLLVSIARTADSGRDVPTRGKSAGVNAASIKAAAGNLVAITAGLGRTKGDNELFLALVDKASAPANADTIIWAEPAFPIDGDSPSAVTSLYAAIQLSQSHFTHAGLRFEVGIAVCWSSTPGTVTLVTADGGMVFNYLYV